MRLLVVTAMWPTPDAPFRGPFVARQVEALRRQGHVVDVAWVPRGRLGPLGWQKYPRLWWRARRPARPGAYDAVIGHLLWPAGQFALAAARRAGVPAIVVAHGQDVANAEQHWFLRLPTRRVVGQAAAVVAVSPDLARRLQAVCPPRGRLEVIDMGVDTDVFRPGAQDVAAHSFGPEPSRPLVVQVANLIERKNPRRLADAVGLLRERRGGGELWIAGAGPLEAELAAIPHVRLLGAMQPEAVARALRAADVAAYVTLREGYGLGALEAVACGVPLVVSDRIPVAADVPPEAAIAVDPTDPLAIADALERALELPRATAAGLATAADHAMGRQAERLAALVAEIVERPGRT
jgi:glycosyltransferase involved in cell wall biosynthesis